MEFSKPLVYLTVTSPFGNRTHPITGEIDSFHNGVDFLAVVGTPVYSLADGKIDNVYYNDTGGNQITINHPEGYRSGYAHLSDTLVEPGSTVKAGQLIAYSGNTGGSTGPHLHFTVKKNGEYINPETIDYNITDIIIENLKKNPIKAGIIGVSVGLLLYLYFKR